MKRTSTVKYKVEVAPVLSVPVPVPLTWATPMSPLKSVMVDGSLPNGGEASADPGKLK